MNMDESERRARMLGMLLHGRGEALPPSLDHGAHRLLRAISEAGSVHLRELPELAGRNGLSPGGARARAGQLADAGLLTRPDHQGLVRLTEQGQQVVM